MIIRVKDETGNFIIIPLGGASTEDDLSEYAKKATTLSGYGITDAYTKTEVENMIGDIDSALDVLHNYAQTLIGGASE